MTALALGVVLAAAETGELARPLGAATVDWAAGTVRARAGAAADMRMPSADLARPGSLRRASARALELLGKALAELPLGAGRKPTAAAIEAALARAERQNVEYQSNGGVVLDMVARFEDLGGAVAGDAGAPPSPRALVAPALPFEAAPLVVCGTREESLRRAVYRVGDAPKDAVAVKVKHGRLVLPAEACAELPALASGGAMIYLRKAPR